MKKLSANKIVKTLFLWFSFAFFGWILYKNAGDYTTILYTLKTADYIYFTWAFVLAFGNLAIMSIIFRSNFSLFFPDITLGYLLKEVIIFSFLTISNPLGVMGGMAFMVKNMVDQGKSYIKSIFAFFSSQLSISIAFLPILLITLIILRQDNQLNQYQIIASEILILMNGFISLTILFILVSPHFSIKVSGLLGSVSNKIFKYFFKKSLVNTDKLSQYIIEISDTSGRFDHSFKRFIKTLIASFIYHGIFIAVLYIIFLAYNSPISILSVIVIYAIIALFSAVSPTPQGVGIVEGLAQVGAISIGIQSEPALVSILTYRLLTIWIPALVGLLVFRSSKKQTVVDSNQS